MAGGGRTAEKSAGETGGYCSSGREERESAREERERPDLGFPEIGTLNPELAIYSKFSSIFRRP